MFREIANEIVGRKKTLDENLSIEEVLALLNGLNGNVRGSIDDSAAFLGTTPVGMDVCGVTPKSMVDFVNSKYPEHEERFYNYARHQVYSRERDEKHYLDLYSLFKRASDELTMKDHSDLHSAKIIFLLDIRN